MFPPDSDDVAVRGSDVGVWRRVREPLRDAVPPLQGPLVLPLRLQAVGESQVSGTQQQS